MKTDYKINITLGILVLSSLGLDDSPARADRRSDALRQRCLAVLRAGLKSDDFWPSMHAAEGLTRAGQGAEVREALQGRLDSERDAQKRCGLARELARAGERDKVAVLLETLADPDPYGHTHAAESLYKIGEVGDGRLLRRAMDRPSMAKLQLMAAAALARRGDSEAFPLIRRHLAGDDSEGRMIAAWILARLGDKSDIPQLRRNLGRESEPLARAYAEHALACLGDAEGRSKLARNLDDPDPAIRAYAAEFAAEYRDPRLVGTLTRRLDDSAIDVRIRAAQALLAFLTADPAGVKESP